MARRWPDSRRGRGQRRRPCLAAVLRIGGRLVRVPNPNRRPFIRWQQGHKADGPEVGRATTTACWPAGPSAAPARQLNGPTAAAPLPGPGKQAGLLRGDLRDSGRRPSGSRARPHGPGGPGGGNSLPEGRRAEASPNRWAGPCGRLFLFLLFYFPFLRS
jgi:hypothetical protein